MSPPTAKPSRVRQAEHKDKGKPDAKPRAPRRLVRKRSASPQRNMGLIEWMEMDTERQKAPKKLATQIRRNALEELRQKREAKSAPATNKPTAISDAAPIEGQPKTSVEEQKLQQGLNSGRGNAKIELPRFKKRRIEQVSDGSKADAAPIEGQPKTSVEEQKVQQGLNSGRGNAKIKLPRFKKRRIEEAGDGSNAPSPKPLRVDNIETSTRSHDVRAKGVLSANHQPTPTDIQTSKGAQSDELNSTNKGDEVSKKRRMEQSAHGKKPDPVKRVRLDGREASTRRHYFKAASS